MDSIMKYVIAFSEWAKSYARSLVSERGTPAGGTTGQVLKKKSTADYDTEWGDGGGSTDYSTLNNKPQINGVTLLGNKTTQELHIIASGAEVYNNYSAAVTAINAWAADHRGVGDNVYIRMTGVPDLWVSGVEGTSVPYTYTTDAAIVAALEADGYVQMGYYKLSALETQKVVIPQFSEFELTFTKADGTVLEKTFLVAGEE